MIHTFDPAQELSALCGLLLNLRTPDKLFQDINHNPLDSMSRQRYVSLQANAKHCQLTTPLCSQAQSVLCNICHETF